MLLRDIDIAMSSVRLSVCLSRSVIVSTRLTIIIRFSAYGSPIILVFPFLNTFRNSEGAIPYTEVEYTCGIWMSRFLSIVRVAATTKCVTRVSSPMKSSPYLCPYVCSTVKNFPSWKTIPHGKILSSTKFMLPAAAHTASVSYVSSPVVAAKA